MKIKNDLLTIVAPAIIPTPAINSTLNLADQAINFTVFRSEKDNIPQAGSLTWLEFVNRMMKHTPRKTKEGASVFSPVTYRKGAKRGNEGVEMITMAVFDVDGGITPDTVKAKLDGFAYVIHSTWSHTSEKPSYRVIISFTSPVFKMEWSQIWARLNLYLGGINDPATKDAARIYYLPSHPEGREDFFVEVGEGKFLDPSELPSLPAVHPTAVMTNVPHEDELGTVEQLAQVQQRCQFVQWASDPTNQPSVSEPLWTSIISNMCRFEGGNAAIHKASCHHPEYDEGKTDAKTDRLRTSSGPATCAHIQALGFADCPAGGCRTISGKITKAPAGLGSWVLKQFPSSQVNKPAHIQSLLNKIFSSGLYYCNESFYAYHAGVWSAQDERADIRRKIAEFFGGNAEAKAINEALTLLKDFQSVREASLNQNKHLICLHNGTLDTNSYSLIEHNPSHGLMTKADIDWNPDEKCPRWLQFLDEIFVTDSDKAQKIAFVQEWFGYCSIPDSSFHKFVWMVGAGGNGKSVLLFILTQLIGAANVSHALIERLDEKYVRAELEGKLVNISSEMSANATVSDGYLKAIVAGDIVEAERKYKPSFSFRPYVRLIGSTNALPRLLDRTEGFARRAIILTFNRIFSEQEQDHFLEQTLLQELLGILTWAVNGLRNLRLRKHFDIPQSSIDALTQYRKDSDPVLLFAEECLVASTGCGLTPARVYQAYRAWNAENGFTPMNNIRFGQRLSEIFGKTGKRRSGGRDYWQVYIKENNDYSFSQGTPLVTPPEPIVQNSYVIDGATIKF